MLIAVLWPVRALADDEWNVVIVTDSPGTEARVRELRKEDFAPWKVVPKGKFEEALRAARRKKPPFNVPLAAALKSEKHRPTALERVRGAATSVGAKAVVFATTPRVPRKRVISVTVIPTASDEEPTTEEIEVGKKPSKSDTEAFRAAIDPLLKKLIPPPPPPEKPKEEPKPTPKVEPVPVAKAPPRVFETSLVLGWASGEMGGRSFSFTDPVTQNLRPYSLFGAGSLAAHVEIYPGAGTPLPFVRDLGMMARYRIALGLSSRAADGGQTGTSWSRYDVGLRYRLRFGDGRAPQLGIGFGFGREGFTFDSANPEYPSTSYVFLRPSLDALIPAGPLSIFANVALMPVVATGRIFDQFRDASAFGFEGELGTYVLLGDYVMLRAAGSYTRYQTSLTSQSTDTFAAGGAGDGYVRLQLGAGAHF